MSKDYTIRTRLTITFLVLAAMVLLVAGISLHSLRTADDRFTDYLSGIDARAKMADRVRSAVDRRAIAARNLVLVTRPADLELEKASVVKAHDDVKANLARLNEMVTRQDANQQGRDFVAEIDKIEQAYGAVALAIVDLALKDKKSDAITKMVDECRPLLASTRFRSGIG